MSHDYSFAIVPFELDGSTNQFHPLDPNSDEGDILDELIEGVQELGFKKDSCFPMNSAFMHLFNEETGGYWQAFLVGGPLKWDSNGRFVVLDKRRRADIPLLRNFLERRKNSKPVLYEMFIQLFDEMERVIKANQGKTVALVIN